MALLDGFDSFTIACFLFIFGLLAVGSGAGSSFASLSLEKSAAPFLTVPVDFVEAAANTGSFLLAGIVLLLFLAYFRYSFDWLGEAFWALVLFAFIAIAVHA